MISIANRAIGEGAPCFIIAELSANHGGNLKTAIQSIQAAKKAGADAIKLQTYTADTITIDCKNDYFKLQHGTLWDGKYLYELYQEAFTPWEWHEQLFQVAREEGLVCFSSPFDFSAVDFLEELQTPAYKIASFEILDIPLIRYVAQKCKPIIISTGIAGEEDIRLALDTCRNAGNDQIILLKCTSSYPAPLEMANLKTIADMKQRFGTEVGLSDHTLGITSPVVAVSLGASVIEKHFILDKNLGGPDAAFSLDPTEFAAMVNAVRQAETALGQVSYDLTEKIKKSRISTGRSLFVVQEVKAGEKITQKNVRSIRPGYGLHPKYYDQILGKTWRKDVGKGTPLQKEMINWN